MNVVVKRIYEPAAKSDGFRVLVDRLWPRGISKSDAKLDLWLPDLGPSTSLRQWFNHDPARWAEFQRRYHAELKQKPAILASITEQAKTSPLTLLYSAKDERYNQAVALRSFLEQRPTVRRPIVRGRKQSLIITGRKKMKAGANMKPVVQLEPTGCGIAAVAALAGVTYRQAQRTANRLGIFATDRRLWSETGHVRRILRKYRLRPASTEQPFRSWSRLPDLALLAIKWHREQGRPCWHWVVFVRGREGERVLDSKRSLTRHTRRDFGRMKPKWYLTVTKKRYNGPSR
jgi:uncharacterized protein YeaO (DUF488 family)